MTMRRPATEPRWRSHREEVEQRLRRVRVPAVARVDHRPVNGARDQVRRARLRRSARRRCRAPSACSVRTVSRSDSPLVTLLAEAVTLTTSAPRRLPASSKRDARAGAVLVEQVDEHTPRRLSSRRRRADPAARACSPARVRSARNSSGVQSSRSSRWRRGGALTAGASTMS